MDYVLYLRVSTKQQGESGLGLEGQRHVAHRFLTPADCIIAEYMEVESGRKPDRPQLALAVAEVQRTGATLLVAELSRLARNLHFLTDLRRNKVRFKACDMPDANELTIDIIGAIAEDFIRTLSRNTKRALDAKKAQGYSLGHPANLTEDVRAKARAKMQHNAAESKANKQARRLIELLRAKGITLAAIADELNSNGYRTRRDKLFSASTVHKLLPKRPKE